MGAITSQVMALPQLAATVAVVDTGFGPMLKRWRAARRLSQEELAFSAHISTRHLSFLENRKAKPSREMVVQLSMALELDLRERNVMLTAAGFAPVYSASPLDSLAMAPVRKAIGLILAKQEPYGAVVVDRLWNVLDMNEGARRLVSRFMPEPPDVPGVASNVVKATLHPLGLRPSLVNWVEAAAYTLERLERECAMFPLDAERAQLLAEVRTYSGVSAVVPAAGPVAAPVLQVHLRRGDDELRMFTMLTTLGTPLDVTAQDLAIETYFPADEAAEAWFRDAAESASE